VHTVTVRTGFFPNFSVQAGQYTVYAPARAGPRRTSPTSMQGVALVGQTLAVQFYGGLHQLLPGIPSTRRGHPGQSGWSGGNFDVTASPPGGQHHPSQAGRRSRPATVTHHQTTGSSLTTTFYVTVGTPAITSVSTSTAIQGETACSTLVGQYTPGPPGSPRSLSARASPTSPTCRYSGLRRRASRSRFL